MRCARHGPALQFVHGGILAWRRDCPERAARLARRQGPGGRTAARVGRGRPAECGRTRRAAGSGHDGADLRRAGPAGRRPARGGGRGEPGDGAPGKEVARIDCRSGHVQRVDRWVVPQRMDVKVTSGHVKLDFTQAVITQSSLKLDIDVRSGHVRLVTKPGIVVDADDVAIRSGHVKVKAPWGSDVPVQLRIEVTGKVGSGHFLAGPRYRTFWRWLTRKPKPYAIASR